MIPLAELSHIRWTSVTFTISPNMCLVYFIDIHLFPCVRSGTRRTSVSLHKSFYNWKLTTSSLRMVNYTFATINDAHTSTTTGILYRQTSHRNGMIVQSALASLKSFVFMQFFLRLLIEYEYPFISFNSASILSHNVFVMLVRHRFRAYNLQFNHCWFSKSILTDLVFNLCWTYNINMIHEIAEHDSCSCTILSWCGVRWYIMDAYLS